MGDDPLDSGFSSSSKHATLQPPFDDYIDVDEIEEEDDLKSELACPFCLEGFDAFGLFCHIDDEHLIDTKSGMCPICVTNLGTNMAAHLITQHEIVLRAFHKKKLHDGESRSILSLLRKELQDKPLQSVPEGSSCFVSSPTDPLLLSFIYNHPLADEPEILQPCSSTEVSNSEKCSDENLLERNIQPYPLSVEDQEKAQRCEFVHNVLFSTILDDYL